MKTLPYPWGEPPRRLLGKCRICGRLMFFRRYRFCESCYRDAQELAREVFEEETSNATD